MDATYPGFADWRLGPRPETQEEFDIRFQRTVESLMKGRTMGEKVGGVLEVGCNENGEIVINHPDLKPDANGVGHIVFLPSQARNLADLLLKHAAQSERDAHVKLEAARMQAAAAMPVDRSARILTDGSPVTDDHRELLPSGQQKGYVVLSAEERAKGFVRPVRRTYRHAVSAGGCGNTTTMAVSLAETYARDPSFYSGTFCVMCRQHFPLDQFVWDGSTELVGS